MTNAPENKASSAGHAASAPQQPSAAQGHQAQPAEARPFQVHLRGVVELLSRNLYSGPQVYLRELLQNAHDAIAARRDLDGKGTHITVTPPSADSAELVIADDGIGLDAGEVEALLATVGRSSKRDFLDMPRQDRLGQFGIGLLSCFMIADEIRVISRSAKPAAQDGERQVVADHGLDGPASGTQVRADTPAPAPVEWVGQTDGTFRVRTLSGAQAAAVPTGTSVILKPRADDAQLARESSVVDLARRFGEYLDTPIDVVRADGRATRVNRAAAFLQPNTADPRALLELGEDLLGSRPLEAIPIDVAATGTTGIAYVLPYAPAPGARQATRIYLGGMLLNTSLEGLLPDWGFFVRCIVNTTGLHPTAGREGLIEDSALEETRAEIGATLRRWLLSVAATRPATLADFMSVHHMGLKAMAVHDDELARLVVPHLRFETSAGSGTLADLAAAHPRLRYADSVEEFRQLAPLAPAGEPLLNAGYVYDTELLRRAPEVIVGLSVMRARPDELVESLAEPPLDYRTQVAALEDAAAAALADLECGVQVRSFGPADVTAVYVTDRRSRRDTMRGQVAAESDGLFGSLLGKLAAGSSQGPGGARTQRGRLCLNWNNGLVRTLAGLTGTPPDQPEHAVRADTFAPAIRVLYVQALLAGQHPLTHADRRILDTSLTDVVKLSVTGAPSEQAQQADAVPDQQAGAVQAQQADTIQGQQSPQPTNTPTARRNP